MSEIYKVMVRTQQGNFKAGSFSTYDEARKAVKYILNNSKYEDVWIDSFTCWTRVEDWIECDIPDWI